MTAAIIAFPTPAERDEIEFQRMGSSNYTRACEEAASLWDAVISGERTASLGKRIDDLSDAIAHLGRYRPEVVGDRVIMNDGCRMELRLVPSMLRAMTGLA